MELKYTVGNGVQFMQHAHDLQFLHVIVTSYENFS